MAVGTDCCDRLTETDEASEYHDRYLKAVISRKRFVSSKRWETLPNGDLQIRQKDIDVSISASDNGFVISMVGSVGRFEYPTVFDAKIKVFDFITSGEAGVFLAQRREKRR